MNLSEYIKRRGYRSVRQVCELTSVGKDTLYREYQKDPRIIRERLDRVATHVVPDHIKRAHDLWGVIKSHGSDKELTPELKSILNRIRDNDNYWFMSNFIKPGDILSAIERYYGVKQD